MAKRLAASRLYCLETTTFSPRCDAGGTGAGREGREGSGGLVGCSASEPSSALLSKLCRNRRRCAKRLVSGSNTIDEGSSGSRGSSCSVEGERTDAREVEAEETEGRAMEEKAEEEAAAAAEVAEEETLPPESVVLSGTASRSVDVSSSTSLSPRSEKVDGLSSSLPLSGKELRVRSRPPILLVRRRSCALACRRAETGSWASLAVGLAPERQHSVKSRTAEELSMAVAARCLMMRTSESEDTSSASL
mmetsp:Transcript_2742/g.8589  ORF Transcript_2742/g.8589 Transcript_2742/m.8589 type:complete len:248 (+) Transcript_2742:303-1046(+)